MNRARCEQCGQKQHAADCPAVPVKKPEPESPKQIMTERLEKVGRPDNRPIFGPKYDRRRRDRRRPEQRRPKADLFKDEYMEGRTLAEVGEHHGVTRERVRQLIEEFYPGLISTEHKRRQQDKVWKRAEAYRKAHEETTRECRVCLRQYSLPKSQSQTYCDDRRCRDIVRNARWLVDPVAHEYNRIRTAYWHLANRADESGSKLKLRRHYQAMVRYYETYGFAPPPTRTFNGGGAHRKNLIDLGVADYHAARIEEHYAGRPLLDQVSCSLLDSQS